MKELRGLGVALVTPFQDNGEIDVQAVHRLVQHCIVGGVDYLVVLGTTGEPATLSDVEKKAIVKEVIAANAGRLPLVIGIGGNNTRAVVECLKQTDLEPFEAVLSVSPYYNRPTQEGIIKHYQALSQATTKPIVIYNVPSRTGSNILPETVIRIAYSCPNICGIKEASADINQVKRIIQGKPERFAVISGDDGTALDTILAGGIGVISVLGQGLPELFSKLVQLGLEDRKQEAKAVEEQLLPGIDLIFEEGNPAGIKALLHFKKVCGTSVRLPLVPATDSLRNRIDQYLGTLAPVRS